MNILIANSLNIRTILSNLILLAVENVTLPFCILIDPDKGKSVLTI